VLASCGGGEGTTETVDDTAAPTIASAVAEPLAERSDEVARRLDAGDTCGAAEEAAALRQAVTDAINGGQVPEEYLEELQGVANELEFELPLCAEPPPPEEDDEEKDGKDKDKGGDGDGDD
jgi:hypothetical protein